jgi:hypothetical protein
VTRAPAVTPAERYRTRLDAFAAARDAAAARSLLISHVRLATVLPGLGLVIYALATRQGLLNASAAAGAALLVAYFVLVVWHARVERRVQWCQALAGVNRRSLAALARDWNAIDAGRPAAAAGGAPPADPDLERHAYAVDLDLFGHASVFQWLGGGATQPGRRTLASWLSRPADPAKIAARQKGVAELAPRLELRQEIAAHGAIVEAERRRDLDTFLAWAVRPGSSATDRPWLAPWLASTARALSIATVGLIALRVADVTTNEYWLVLVTVNLALSFGLARWIHPDFDRAGSGQGTLAGYAGILRLLAGGDFTAPSLVAIQDRLRAGGLVADQQLGRLDRILGHADLRFSALILHATVQAVTLWDVHVWLALEAWRRRAGPHVGGWLSALGEADALCALAAVAHDHPDWAFPTISASCPPALAADALGHPLIADGVRVDNDVTIGPPGTFLLVTGSNMSGKSTLLRAVGVNVVLAQAGSVVCARRLTLPPVDVRTTGRVDDSLETGVSYFMAGLERLKDVVFAARRARAEGRTVLYLLDEILQGTNSAERQIAVRRSVGHLVSLGAIGAISTHDLALAATPALESAARAVHLTETVESDAAGRPLMTFDYRLRPGLATSSNALLLLRLLGLDDADEEPRG